MDDAPRKVECRAEAEAAFRHAMDLDPGNPAPIMKLAEFLADAGRIPDTAPLLKRVLELAPGHSGAVSGLLATRLYDPTWTPEELSRFHRDWCASLEARVRPLPPARPERNLHRRLRVAYLSSDFRQHSCADFIEPLLRAHDRRQVEVLLFNSYPRHDARTRVFQRLADVWVEVHALADAELAEAIRRAQVDVLVDLSGHSAFNRLTMLPLRPAPVQLEWLGYPFTTGLNCLEGRITDSRVDPPGQEALSSEPLLRLDPCYLCWEPPAGLPEPATSPCLRGAAFTFGSFNHFAKLNGAVVETWAALLRRVPDSILLLKGKGASDSVLRGRLLKGFIDEGVRADRIQFAGFLDDSAAHFASYGQVDLALDPFPYNGVTTTLEALWMGVPVLAMEGRHSLSRHGAAILGLLGLDELVASDPMDYADRAATLASDPVRLQALRAGMRKRLSDSPIRDPLGFARRMEELYRQLWIKACEGLA
ncbi:MAG: hypothetical protein KGN80_03635 [Acidobacteriota bacterium]|nr:hypothetical protein [Acidobacteriota bacterium]